MKSFSSLLCCLLLAVSAAGCWVPELPDDTLFSCDTTADCAEEGVVCAPRGAGLRGFCCKPNTEVCNGVDDDCNAVKDDLAGAPCYTGPEGTLGKGECKAGRPACGANGQMACAGEVQPTAELCNGKDDDCDGVPDVEEFDLKTDMANCGACGRACNAASESCVNGACSRRSELDCGNNVDDDGDGNKDCADLVDCDKKSCGANCICVNGKRGEGTCGDNQDNDGDGDVDCVDLDCVDQSCGTGCVCSSNYAKAEADCTDGVDNDKDGLTDCADTVDCSNKSCGTHCVCQGGKAIEQVCNDGIDNDRNQGADCADPDCNNKECGVGGCTCRFSRAVETNCGDGLDNDNDKSADCADYDCAYTDFGNGTRCQDLKRVEFNCADGKDNDGDGNTDCVDTDCAGVSRNATTICSVSTRGANAYDESNCTDGQDNDADGRTDCRTNGQGADSNCSSGTGSCGFGCQILSCDPSKTTVVKKETVCDDNVDNDGDNARDCDDTDCNTAPGQACRKADGTAGRCQSNKTCI